MTSYISKMKVLILAFHERSAVGFLKEHLWESRMGHTRLVMPFLNFLKSAAPKLQRT